MLFHFSENMYRKVQEIKKEVYGSHFLHADKL